MQKQQKKKKIGLKLLKEIEREDNNA